MSILLYVLFHLNSVEPPPVELSVGVISDCASSTGSIKVNTINHWLRALCIKVIFIACLLLNVITLSIALEQYLFCVAVTFAPSGDSTNHHCFAPNILLNVM